MHRHVIAHGDDLACGIEDGAGVVAALFDIGGKRSAAQCGSHFFGDGVVEILEDLEFDRIAHGRDECTPTPCSYGAIIATCPRVGFVSRSFSMRSLTVIVVLVALFSVSAAKDEFRAS